MPGHAMPACRHLNPPPLTLHRLRSAHEVNTARCVLKSSSMRHTEGGWPKDVDPGEQADVTRYRKKVEKDEEYKAAVKALGPLLARGLKQNNAVDVYEELFTGPEYGVTGLMGGGGFGHADDGGPAAAAAAALAAAAATATSASASKAAPSSSPRGGPRGGAGGPSTASSTAAAAAAVSALAASDPPSAKGLAVFRDPCPVKRAATMLNWHPEGHGKLAVAYSLLNFQVGVYSY